MPRWLKIEAIRAEFHPKIEKAMEELRGTLYRAAAVRLRAEACGRPESPRCAGRPRSAGDQEEEFRPFARRSPRSSAMNWRSCGTFSVRSNRTRSRT